MERKYHGLTKKQLVKSYADMLLIRRFEEKAGQLYGLGLIGGFCHLYIGQEAVAIGMRHSVQKGDSVITSYRDHGLMLSCGSDPKSVMAELMGKETGCSKGKGGSMHMFDYESGFLGGHGIVGAQVPIGTGMAYANQYKENNGVVFVYFGDGAANQGQVYESFNMASLWNLAVVYVLENNEYAMGTSVTRATATTDLYKRGESFNIPGLRVDGLDFFAVLDAGIKATDHCRAGNGPILLEMKTYRYRGHSMSDPANYRSKAEVENIKCNRDPIDNMKKHLMEGNILTEDECSACDDKVRTVVQESVEFAQNSSEPDASELWTDVFA